MMKSEKSLLAMVCYIVALDYIGLLLSDNVVIKLLSIIPVALFMMWKAQNNITKIISIFFFAMICCVLPSSHIFSSMLIISFLLIHAVFDKDRNLESGNYFATQFGITYCTLSIMYWYIPLVFNTFEHLSNNITSLLTLGTSFGTEASMLIPSLSIFITLGMNVNRTNLKIILKNIVSISLLYTLLINITVVILDTNQLFGLLMIPIEVYILCNFVSFDFVNNQRTEHTFTKFRVATISAFCIALTATMLMPLTPKLENNETLNIAVLKSDEAMVDLNQEPARGEYIGFGMSSFMFSSFEMYLESMGYNITIEDSLSEIDYSNIDTLLLIHHNKSNSENDIKLVRNFVESGGNIIAFGDHNNLFNSTVQTNELLEFSGLEIKDDISDNILRSHSIVWRNSLSQFLGNPLITDIKMVDETKIGVWGGASVKTNNFLSTPLLIANYGISDPSMEHPNSQGEYMGNRLFDRGDGYASIPLGYATNYGDGKVIVYGDTSYLQVPQLMYNWEFIYNHFNSSNKTLMPNSVQIILSIVLILSIFLISKVYVYGTNHSRISLLSSMLFTILLCTFITTFTLSQNHKNITENLSGDYLVIDNLHDNFYSTSMLEKDSITGLGYISMTHNQPAFVFTSDKSKNAIQNANMYVIINPNKQVDSEYIESLLHTSTDVLIIGGKEYEEHLDSLLKHYDISISDTFLGPIPWSHPMLQDSINVNEPEFVEAWQLNYDNHTTYPLYEKDGYVPAVYKNVGNSTLYVIADSRFFDKDNVEGELSGKLHNIEFIEKIIFTE